jgi:nitrate reductase NapE component
MSEDESMGRSHSMNNGFKFLVWGIHFGHGTAMVGGFGFLLGLLR